MGATDTQPAAQAATVPIGLVAVDAAVRADLADGLAAHGIRTEGDADLEAFLRKPDAGRARALLVDVTGASDALLDRLLELEGLPPLLFHEEPGGPNRGVRMRRLATKILAAAAADDAPAPGPAVSVPSLWVLGASFGGPEAVKRFLEAVPHVPDAAFILVQHIGEGFVDLLASQLNRSTPFRVMSLTSGVSLERGAVYVVPVGSTLTIGPGDTVELVSETGAQRGYQPSIDSVMAAVARSHSDRAGAIVFSGMGNDGTEGARAMAEVGGTVWAQDSASSAMASMPDCAAALGVVRRRGTPEALAGALCDVIRPVEGSD